ncbi:aminotransferase class I/II-fold pyridoxal phosphate-dependent enzyme [Marinifilum sp. N1E240]|uniref:pyridoxal phosphate-dependent aminotransferase n=1 Tax=Marinifilum sp. N1E240 TaxID=2608082 RepID=UPI00128C440D|nr:aminotransferase class I/II-fold pyridoxal phosphate-dependent enzyme [Marinifilum sp. N1E240]MPQ48244.1 aminotransferase class I/II-fold pyridoxal phosphate-dependent enzyme [Marinifilum sp. N1E240]
MIQPANRTQGVKEYYFSVKLKEIARLNEGEVKVLNLGIGDPDLSPSEDTWNSLKEACVHPKSHGYQSYQGIPALREGFSKWYKTYFDVEINPANEVLPLMGSKEGIMITSLAYLNEGDEILIPDPSYPTYKSVTNLLGSKIVTYSLNEEQKWQPDLEALEQRDLSKVKMMWINYPHMPTGARASRELLERIVAFGRKHNILIVNDNPYSFILNDEPMSIMSIEGAKDCCLELNSLSKSHNMPGWRVGMICGSAEMLEPVLKVKTNMDSGMFYPVQQAAIKALNQDKSWYESINKVYKSRRELVFKLMDLIDCKPSEDQSGMFVWAAIPEKYKDCYELSDDILNKAKVFITPGGIFGEQGLKYIRVSLCSSEAVLEEAIERIKRM